MTLDDLDPGDKVQLIDPSKYTNTQPGEIYTITRLPNGFVDITSTTGRELTVEPADLRYA